jgi:NADH:ubiquinone oxidoreductase subunit 4 (subunit M)
MLSLVSLIYASFITLRQFDLKKIIAYSSIAHMNLVIIGLFTTNIYGLEGAIFLMIGHAIVSSALFYIIGVIYDRYHTRLIFYYSGLIQIMPLYGILTFLFFLGNIGFPGTSNFIGEFLILLASFLENPLLTIFSGIGILFSGIYSL